MENQRLDPDVERVAAQDYEVEVPPCERGAKDFPSPIRRGARGEVQKSDRSADASGASHRLPSPFQSKRKDVHSIKKTLLHVFAESRMATSETGFTQ